MTTAVMTLCGIAAIVAITLGFIAGALVATAHRRRS